MDEEEYQKLMIKAKDILEAIRAFPAHSFNAFAKDKHPEDESFATLMWSVHCEVEPY